MTVNDFYDKVNEIFEECEYGDSEVYIQIGNSQCKLKGIALYKEVEGVCNESIVLGDLEKPKLFVELSQ